MKKLISVLLAALMLLSCASAVMADVTEYELFTDTDETVYTLGKTVFPTVDGLVNYTITGQKVYLPNPVAVGDKGYACLILRKTNETNPKAYDPVTFAEILNGDNIYDYELQINLQRLAGTIYVADLEIGFGNYAAGKQQAQGCSTCPAVAKTVYLGNVMSGMANGTNQTFAIDVVDILNNGNEQKFSYEGTEPNELTAENANLIAVKATCNNASGGSNFLQINSIKLVKKNDNVNIPTVIDFKGTSGISFAGSEAPASTDGSYRVFVGQGSYKFSPKTGTQIGDTLYGHHSARVDSNTPFLVNSLFGDAKMEDYVLELGIKKLTSGNYIENIEFGLACCNGGSSYTSLPASLKTVNANFDETYKTMAIGDIATVTVPVKDIFTKGNSKDITKDTKLVPTFAVENITGVAIKATATADVASTMGAISLESMKFIRKTADITFDEEFGTIDFSVSDYSDAPSGINGQALVAYYKNVDGNDKLIGCDILPLNASSDNEAAASIPKDSVKESEATKIKAILFNSINSIAPLTQAVTIYEAE